MASRRNRFLITCAAAIAFIAVVVGIAVPNLLRSIQRDHSKRYLGDMRAIGAALEAYAKENGSFPELSGRRPVDTLAVYLVPTYIKVLPTTDAWDGPFLCSCGRSTYELWSLGADGREGPNYADGPTDDPNADVVFRNGQFVRFPRSLLPR